MPNDQQPPPPSPLLPMLVAGALLMENIDATVLNTVAHTIADDFGVHPLQLKYASTAYLLGLSVGIPVSGRLADAYGARLVFTVALRLFLLGSLACGSSFHLLPLVLSRLLQGLGGALMVPVARLVLLRAYPKGELVRITNLTSLPALLGPALGPLLGGALATFVHWRAVFFVNVPLCVAGLWAARRSLSPARAQGAAPLDGIAFATFACGLGGLSFAFECVGDPLLSTSQQAWLWAGALASFSAFAAWQARVGDTLFRLSLFRLRTFRLGVMGNFVSRLGVGSTPFLLPLMLQMRFGYSPLQAGLHVAPLSFGMLAARGLVSPLLGRFGFRRLLVANTLCLGAALASLSAIGLGTPMPAQVLLVAIYGLFASIHFACMNVLAYVDVEPADMASATSLVSTVHTLGMGAGIALGALLVGIFLQAGASLPGGAAYAFHRTFALLGLCTAATAGLFGRLADEDGGGVARRAQTARGA